MSINRPLPARIGFSQRVIGKGRAAAPLSIWVARRRTDGLVLSLDGLHSPTSGKRGYLLFLTYSDRWIAALCFRAAAADILARGPRAVDRVSHIVTKTEPFRHG